MRPVEAWEEVPQLRATLDPEQVVDMGPVVAHLGLAGLELLVRESVEDRATLPAVVQAQGAAALRVRVDGVCPVLPEKDLIQADRTVGPTLRQESAARVPRELAQGPWLWKQV